MREGTHRDFAWNFRRHMTDAEQLLWRHLRRRQLLGHRFRRQHPFGQYILDFVCLEQGLVVELDGSQHLDSARDRSRDEWLRAASFRTLRFWNNDMLQRTDDVLDAIASALSSAAAS